MESLDLSLRLEERGSESKKATLKKHCKSIRKNKNLWGLIKFAFPLQVYKVVVNTGEQSWFIFRRYNEFHGLYEKVRLYIYIYIYTVSPVYKAIFI